MTAQAESLNEPGKRRFGLFADHPPGLPNLFFTEMWERFSYYGMRALLVLYMVAAVADGGLGYSNENAVFIYAAYTTTVYLMSVPGGLIADRILGYKNAVLLGGIIIACGHFSMAVPMVPFFYLGMVLVVLGTGLLKPNISSMLGSLYKEGDPRRDSGFSLFYMGINVGAAASPLVCGFLAQADEFKRFLVSINLPEHASWHFGFAAAGVGMLFGLVNLVLQWKTLGEAGNKPREVKKKDRVKLEPLSKDEWQKLGALAILFVFNILFWGIYEQGGSSLNIFADKCTDTVIFGWNMPSTWLQSFQAIFCIILAPVYSWFWIKLGDKQPSSPAKFTWGIGLLGLGIALMVPASMLAAKGLVSPLWLTMVYLLEVLGELCLSPVGLSVVTKLAPARFLGLTMGVWFCSMALGNTLAGLMGRFFDENDMSGMVFLYGKMAGAA
ncbi:MAG: peptide MFS transporter, partial [Candidatus Obscuribacterales bacterium]|nr:peptide MFS transporter [Candidatus Obscuribacterales bacterium]